MPDDTPPETTALVAPAAVMPGKNGGMLRRGNPGNKGGRGTPSWIRQQFRDGLATGLAKLRKAIRTKKDPFTGEDLSNADWLKCIEVAGKYGVGTPIEVGGPDGAPFTVAVMAVHAAQPAED